MGWVSLVFAGQVPGQTRNSRSCRGYSKIEIMILPTGLGRPQSVSICLEIVGGCTNPFEKYARPNGFIFPNFRGENSKNIWVATTEPKKKWHTNLLPKKRHIWIVSCFRLHVLGIWFIRFIQHFPGHNFNPLNKNRTSKLGDLLPLKWLNIPWNLTYPLKNDGWFRCISYCPFLGDIR